VLSGPCALFAGVACTRSDAAAGRPCAEYCRPEHHQVLRSRLAHEHAHGRDLWSPHARVFERPSHRLARLRRLRASIDFNGSASKNVLEGTMKDLAEQIRAAEPMQVGISQDAWLASRGGGLPRGGHQKSDGATPAEQKEASASAPTSGAVFAVIPMQLPRLPTGFIMRPEVLDKARAALLQSQPQDPLALVPELVLRGMGGAGKA